MRLVSWAVGSAFLTQDAAWMSRKASAIVSVEAAARSPVTGRTTAWGRCTTDLGARSKCTLETGTDTPTRMG